MKFEIGQRVRYFRDANHLNRYLIIATKEQNLNTDYINSLDGSFSISDFERIAEITVSVSNHYDYIICKEDEYFEKGKSKLIGNFISVAEDDISN